MLIKSYAAASAKSLLNPLSWESKPLKNHEVRIKTSHCGICYSDIHLIDNDWGISQFPLVPGHEIIGHVAAKGSEVKNLELGQRVGVGWACGACLECEYCLRGDDNLCGQSQATAVGRFGGFSEAVIVDSRFAFAIPENLSSSNAAPLLCGGITVYAPLKVYDIKPSMRVAVIGIGGLGHLALQFARAWGCEVTAFSTSQSKAAEAESLGAHHFYASLDSSVMQKLARSFDLVLSTVHADLDWAGILEMLRPDGKLCFVGVPHSSIKISAFSLIVGRRSICGNPTGSRSQIKEMLEFAARHAIQAKTEVLPAQELNTAIAKIRDNKARYRMVLEF